MKNKFIKNLVNSTKSLIGCLLFNYSKKENQIFLYHEISQEPSIFAKENKFQSVRLDTFSQNPRNLQFYTKRGYKKTGEVYFPRIKEYSFYCYELVF